MIFTFKSAQKLKTDAFPVSVSHSLDVNIVGFFAFALPILAVPAPLGVTVWIALLAAVFGIAGANGWILIRISPVWWLCVPLILWSCLSLLWSIDPSRSLQRIPKILAVFALGITMHTLIRTTLLAQFRIAALHAMIAGLALAGLILLIEAHSGAQLVRFYSGDSLWSETLVHRTSYYNRSFSILIPLLLILFCSWKKLTFPWKFLLVFAAFSVTDAILSFKEETPLWSLTAGFIAFLAAFCAPRLISRMLLVGFIIGALVTPLITPSVVDWIETKIENPLSNSIQHRLVMWDFLSKRSLERPLTGWGIEASRSIPNADERYLDDNYASKYVSHHPHNLVLQLWSELGLVGVIFACIPFGWLAWRLGQDESITGQARRWLIAGRVGAVVAFLMVANSSYGMWQEWRLATCFVLLNLAVFFSQLHNPKEV